jgi:23S rRNA pseudouridine1911/1915/1917 synthase
MRRRFVTNSEDRLEKQIALHTDLSRRRARAAIERGGVRVDGKAQKFASAVIPSGAVVEVRSNAAPDSTALLPIRYHDTSVVVVDKPAGMPSQPTREGKAHHVFGIVAARERYAGLHHRLDTPASGLMLLTTHPAANPAVSALFSEGRIAREYRVAVLGDPGPEGRWEGPVDGLPAATRFVREGQRGAFSFLRCTLETGRTHQIRQHALAAGTPVVGDRRYGGAAGRAWPRLALHAAVLRFPHPRTGVPVQVLSPLPADLCALFGEDPPPVERQRRSAARAAEAQAAGVDSDALDDDLDDLDDDLDEDLDGEGEE